MYWSHCNSLGSSLQTLPPLKFSQKLLETSPPPSAATASPARASAPGGPSANGSLQNSETIICALGAMAWEYSTSSAVSTSHPVPLLLGHGLQSQINCSVWVGKPY